MTEQTQKTKTRFTPKKVLCFAVALLLFSAIVSYLFTANADDGNRAANFMRGAFTGGGEVRDGALEIEGIEMPVEIPEGEIRYFINKDVVFANTYTRGDIVLQNPEQCSYVLQFRFYLADGSSNKPIYTSPKLCPGQYLSEDKLDRYVAAGTYDCTYTVTAYALDDDSTEAGRMSGFLTLMVVH